MRSKWLVFTLAVMACGEVKHGDGDGGIDAPTDPDQTFVSGTRLKLQWMDFGGTRSPRGIIDTQLSTECYFSPWTDGQLRCTPSTAVGTVFANATCSQQMAQVYHPPTCSTQPAAQFVLESTVSTCTNTLSRMYRLGTALAATQFWQQASDGSCQGPFTSANVDYFAIGAEVPMTELVAATIVPGTTAGRLSESTLQTPDGLRIPNRVHDSQLDVDCYPQPVPLDKTLAQCGPSDAAYAGYFTDAACSQRTAQRGTACTAPKAAVAYGNCPYEAPQYFQIGAAIRTTSLYYQGDSCFAVGTDPSTSYYALGAPIEIATLARGHVSGGSSRLSPIRLTTPEGLSTRDYSLYDSQLGAECYPSQMQDGTALCVPSGASWQALFSDAACTAEAPVALVYRGRDTCSPPPLPTYAVASMPVSECVSSIETRLIGAPHTAPLFQKLDDTTCVAFSAPSQGIYDVGPVIPQAQLAAGTVVTDP